jgi:hypothetical protein
MTATETQPQTHPETPTIAFAQVATLLGAVTAWRPRPPSGVILMTSAA